MTVKDRYSGIQTLFKTANESSCHFLSLLSIAEEENIRLGKSNPNIDLIDAIRISQSKQWMNHDFTVTVQGSLDLLKHYTGKKWTRREVKKLPLKIKPNEYTEVIYKNDSTGFKHYRRRYFDTLENSITVRDGYISAYYIYTCEE